MLLMRDRRHRNDANRRLERHLRVLAEVYAGRCDLRALHLAKLTDTLAAAARAPMYATSVPPMLEPLDRPRTLEELLASLPLLTKAELSARSHDVFTHGPEEFLHYYETSGTTGPPSAAPKAVDDLIVNTANIGEMWSRLLTPDDVALILIIGTLAPAPYQMEKALEYLGIMSLRPWVDYIDGDYAKVLSLIEDLSVNVFVGAPSRLLAMIQFAYRHGLPAPRFDHLLLLAEQAGPALLSHLGRLTGARAHVGTYGSSEAGTIAVTCEHSRLHLQLQSFVVELYDDERGARLVDGTADAGELVVTTLDLPGRPLLRYHTGDLIEVDDRPCECGLALPVMRTRGRAQDVVAIPGGALRQEDVEASLWAANAPGATILNYMLIVRGTQIVCLTTTDRPADAEWASATARRIGPLFPAQQVTVRPVEALSPLASLSGDLGWKLSRVLDLDQQDAWKRLPDHMAAVVHDALHTSREELAADVASR